MALWLYSPSSDLGFGFWDCWASVVNASKDAAEALEPLAGHWATIVFGVGLLASAIIAVPVIAATSAYVTAEMFGWRRSLNKTFAQARKFYMLLILLTALAVGIAFLGIPPIQLLYASGIAGGIATPFTLVLLLLIARDPVVMHGARIKPWLAICGWAVAGVVTLATVLFLYQSLTGTG